MYSMLRSRLCRVGGATLMISLGTVLVPPGPLPRPSVPEPTYMVALTPTSSPTPTKTPTRTTTPTPTRTTTPTGSFTTTTSPSHTRASPGESITVTVRLANETTDHCFGMPQFRLYVETAPGVGQDPAAPIFAPANPEPITVYTGVQPGQSTSATFTLTAARSGTVTFYATASGEGGSSTCGPPYYWTGATPSRSLSVSVTGSAIYLPIVAGDGLAAGRR
jgi:hypothetical protein